VELLFVGERTRRARLLVEARELAERSGDPLALVEVSACVFNARPRSTWSAEELRNDLAFVADAVEASEGLTDSYWIAATVWASAFFALAVGDGDELRAHAARLTALAEGDATAHRAGFIIDQMTATISGRLVEAEALSQEQYDLWRRAGMPEAITYRSVEQLAVKREQDRLAEIIPGWMRFLSAHPAVAGSSAGVVAFAFAETGALDEAAARLHEADRAGFDTIPDEAGWPLAVASWVEVAACTRDVEAAGALHELLAALDGMVNMTGGIVCGPIARLLAMLEVLMGRASDADAHFAAAIDQSESLGSPVWVARCCFDWAGALVASGESVRARQLVDRGDAAIAGLTLARLERQSSELRARLDA
jgi:hypothetical protein